MRYTLFSQNCNSGNQLVLAPTLNPLRTIPGIQVHYANERLCLASRGLGFYGSSDRGVNWRKYGFIPGMQGAHWLMLFAPYQRLLRGGINSIQPWANTGTPGSPGFSTESPNLEEMAWVAMSGGSLFKIAENGKQIRPFWDLRNGRRTLYRGMATAGSHLFICDYWPNTQRSAANVYRINLTTEKSEVLYQFAAGSMRHIHNVEVDPISGQLWLSTGDEDHECQVCYLDPQTGKYKQIGGGNQQWRAVSFIFRDDAVYWGTDDPMGENQIWRYDRRSNKLQSIGSVKGPVYYCKNTQDFIIFGTAVEHGQGQQDGYGRLYAAQVAHKGKPLSTDTVTLHEIFRQHKDGWHPKYFGYGLFELNAGDVGGNQFWAAFKGFKGGLRSTLFHIEASALGPER